MKPEIVTLPNVSSALVRVHREASGHYAAQVIGLPEIQATATSSEEAVAQVRERLSQWLETGKLVSLIFPSFPPMRKPAGWAKDEQLEREFLEDLARMRQEDLERTLREDEERMPECSNTSSIPTT